MERFLKFFDSNPKIKKLIIDYSDQIKKIAVISVLILGVFVVFVVTGDKGAKAISEEAIVNSETSVTSNIYVDIGGEVVSPMLAELPEGSRVEDAINAAGGLTDQADLSSINRAKFLEDGEKIFIPAQVEGDSVYESGITNGKININTADSDALQTLNGVGPATAEKIMDYRENSGGFETIEDLKNVAGIGEKTFDKLKDYICV